MMENEKHTDPVDEVTSGTTGADEQDTVQQAEDAADNAMQHVESELSDLQATVAELKDKHIRLLAEFDNYKKRTMRERLDLMASASKDVMLALLPVLDDFDRARKAAEANPNVEPFSEGVSLVYNRLYSTLQAKGLKAMDSTGQPFDPEWHEAITEIPAPTPDLKGKVVDTIEKGYLLNDSIIRYAKVVVGN
jgi:molecular chaperone GrpE